MLIADDAWKCATAGRILVAAATRWSSTTWSQRLGIIDVWKIFGVERSSSAL